MESQAAFVLLAFLYLASPLATVQAGESTDEETRRYYISPQLPAYLAIPRIFIFPSTLPTRSRCDSFAESCTRTVPRVLFRHRV